MSANVSGQAYALMVLTPITPGEEGALRAYLEGLRDKGGPSPLAKLPRTHMGRWVIVEDFYNDPAYDQPKEDHLDLQYLVFTSNFDGALDSYLDELCEHMGEEARAIWGHCVGLEADASASELKAYLLHNQIDTGIFVAAYGEAKIGKVKTSLDQRERMIDFAVRAQGMEPAELQKAFLEEFAG